MHDVPAEWQNLRFVGDDDLGKLLASGIYFYRVTAGAETVTRNMLIMR